MKKKHNIKIGASVFVVAMFLATTVTVTAVWDKKDCHVIPPPPPYAILWSKSWVDGYVSTEGKKPTVDSQGNVYTIGSTVSMGPVIIKYDKNGNQKWVKQIDVDGIVSSNPVSLAQYVNAGKGGEIPDSVYTLKGVGYSVDDSTRFYLDWIGTGPSDTIMIRAELDYQYETYNLTYVVLLKYDQNGNQIWNNTYDLFGFLLAIGPSAIDSNGYVYTQCYSMLGNFLLKVQPDGSVDSFTYDCLPVWIPLGCTFDSNKDIVSVFLNCLTYPDASFLVTKQSHTDLSTIDENTITCTLSTSYIWDCGIAVDSTDNSIFFAITTIVVKIDASLNKVWQITHDYCGGFLSDYYAADVDVWKNSIIVTGGEYISNNIAYYVAVKYNKDTGAKQLIINLGQHLPSDMLDFHNQLNGCVIDPWNDLVFAGASAGIKTIKTRINGWYMESQQVVD